MLDEALEQIVIDTFEDVLKLNKNPGSGNLRGDGDVGPATLSLNDTIKLGFECKDKGSMSHTVLDNEWQKAKLQLTRRGLDPVFVTRNKADEVLVHMSLDLLKLLMELINERTSN
jgi:hypothetical protein